MADELRFITADDPLFPAAAALRFEVLHRPLGLGREHDWDDRDPQSRHLVALRDGKVVGYARLVMSDRAARIRHLAVSPHARGGGVGGRIVEALVAQARKERRTLVWLNARFTALGFWQRMGFRETGGLTDAEDTYLPHKRMERSLA